MRKLCRHIGATAILFVIPICANAQQPNLDVPKGMTPPPASNKIYLEADDLFADVAARTAGQQSVAESQEKFGRSIESQLGKKNRERKAAEFLLQLNKHSNAMSSIGEGNAGAESISLEAGDLFAEYVIALVDDTAQASAANSDKDKLLELAKKLRDKKVQGMLRQSLEEKLGTGPGREERAAQLLLQIADSLTPEKQAELRNILRNRDPKALELRWPLCMWNGCN